MAIIQRLLTRATVIAAFALLCVCPVSAQNVMHFRIDTVTANPGATVDVRVLYTFTSTHAHNIHDFNARFLFDTTASQLVAYIMDGTASADLTDTTGSHAGLLALGNQEIDLTDSVLFKIRMTIDSNADTAWIKWDRNWIVFGAGDEGVDSVYQQDGWIRTPKSKANVKTSSASELPRLYPNPASERVTIDAPEYTEGATLEVFAVTGRLAFSGPLGSGGGWQIPSEFQAGAYEVVLSDSRRGSEYVGTLIVAPR